jgi:hypothetical protein
VRETGLSIVTDNNCKFMYLIFEPIRRLSAAASYKPQNVCLLLFKLANKIKAPVVFSLEQLLRTKFKLN